MEIMIKIVYDLKIGISKRIDPVALLVENIDKLFI